MIIVFDLFGVVLTSGFISSKRRLSRLLRRSPDQIASVYRKWEIPFDLGQIDSREFWDRVNHELGTSVDWQDLNKAVLESYQPMPGAFDLLQRYVRTCPLYLLSNTRKEWFQYLDSKFNFVRYFQDVFVSYEMGSRKPDPEVFLRVLNILDARPWDLFLVDDEPANVLSAASIGIMGTVFRSTFEAEVDLHARIGFDTIQYQRSYSGVLLISQDGRLILQRRERRPSITNPGLITTFGGILKQGESFAECALREINEELLYELDSSHLMYLTELSKPERDGSWTFCNFYSAFGIDPSCLNLREGEAIELLRPREAIRNKKLSPVCKVVVQHYIQRLANE